VPAPVRDPSVRCLVGAARADITPPVGIYHRSWGAAEHDRAEGIHRPLTATALALRSSGAAPPLVLLSLDLGWWQSRDDEWELRGAVCDALGVGTERVVLALSHTHAGPAITRALADRPGGDLIGPYLDRVRDEVVAAARRAADAAEPGTLAWAVGRSDLAAHRDLPDGNRYLCGFDPDGEADDTLVVGRATADDGRVLATVVNYACHPTTLAWANRLISPDWVGAMREVVEAATGGAPCLFLMGASGELGPRDGLTGDVEVADRNGRRLGHAAVAALEKLLPPGTELVQAPPVESGAPLAPWEPRPRELPTNLETERLAVDVPLRPDLPDVSEIEAELAGATEPFQIERLRRRIRVLRSVRPEIEVFLWRLGEATLLAQPAEAYSLLQRELRARTGRLLVVANLANGISVGYLPPRELYGRDLYQVWQTPYAEGSLERMIEAAAAAL
jgi:hypothetical protein